MSRIVMCTHCQWHVTEGAGHSLLDCVRFMKADVNQFRATLAHERDRAKRVVRVFWRVRYLDGVTVHHGNRTSAFRGLWKYPGAMVYRVTVRRVKR